MGMPVASICGVFANTLRATAPGLIAMVAMTAAPVHALAADNIVSVGLVGDSFTVVLQSGKTLSGRELKGATIGLRLNGRADPVRVTFADIVESPDSEAGDVLLYHMLVPGADGGAPEELCEPDLTGGRWAVPLQGSWTEDGFRNGDSGFTLACTATALGKCVRFGYPPWHTTPDGVSLAAYHQACVHMVRAAYCEGHGTTRDGMLIDYFDNLGITLAARQEEAKGLQFEAAWGVDGALCVAHTRVPEHVTVDGLRVECPGLRGRLGEEECSLEGAQAGRYGQALLFNKSK